MHVVVRYYKGNTKIIDEIVQRSEDVEGILRGIPGFVAYHAVKTAEDGFSLSVYEDKAGTEESTRQAAAYVRENLASVVTEAPQVFEGESVLHFTR